MGKVKEDLILKVIAARNDQELRRATGLAAAGYDAKKVRKVLSLLHPDRNPGRVEEANQAFIKFNGWVASIAGISGSVSVDEPEVPDQAKVVNIGKKSYSLDRLVWQRPGLRYYLNGENDVLVSVTDPGLDWAANGVTTFNNAIKTYDERETVFYLDCLKSREYHPPEGISVYSIYNRPEGDFKTLKEVVKTTRFGRGLTPKSMAWIYRRAITAVGRLHDSGVSVNSLDSESFVIDTESHGLLLKDTQYCTKFGEKITAVSPECLERLSRRIRHDKISFDGREDLSILSGVINDLMDFDARPDWLRRFMQFGIKAAPKDARVLLADFDEICEQHWGPRAFHKFEA